MGFIKIAIFTKERLYPGPKKSILYTIIQKISFMFGNIFLNHPKFAYFVFRYKIILTNFKFFFYFKLTCLCFFIFGEQKYRHGPVFRTSLFGGRVIISMDNELNMEMAKTNRTIGVPKSITRLLGNNNLIICAEHRLP